MLLLQRLLIDLECDVCIKGSSLTPNSLSVLRSDVLSPEGDPTSILCFRANSQIIINGLRSQLDSAGIGSILSEVARSRTVSLGRRQSTEKEKLQTRKTASLFLLRLAIRVAPSEFLEEH